MLIFVHELGHFATAKWFGIDVIEFGFGFPPRIYGIRYRGTVYSINWIPLGGFVRMLGEEDPSADNSFARQTPMKRAIVLLAGSFMNVLLAIIIFALLFMTTHKTLMGGSISVVGIVPGSPAYEAGLRQGDTIVSINDYNIASLPESLGRLKGLTDQIDANRGKPTKLSVRRINRSAGVTTSPELFSIETLSLVPRSKDPPPQVVVETVTDPLAVVVDLSSHFGLMLTKDGSFDYSAENSYPTKVSETQISLEAAHTYDSRLKIGDRIQQKAIGVSLAVSGARAEDTKKSVWSAFPLSIRTIWTDVILVTVREIGRGISTRTNPGITGPIGIAHATDEAVSSVGVGAVIGLTGVLSVSLGVLNVLPIPGLDGGRLLFVVLEWVRRGKRISPSKEGLVHLVGFVSMIGILLILSYSDILRLINGNSFY